MGCHPLLILYLVSVSISGVCSGLQASVVFVFSGGGPILHLQYFHVVHYFYCVSPAGLVLRCMVLLVWRGFNQAGVRLFVVLQSVAGLGVWV